ncbi:hypothetical protein [Nonomuraea cavernae]
MTIRADVLDVTIRADLLDVFRDRPGAAVIPLAPLRGTRVVHHQT